jgi:hypothetical protein
MQPIKGEKMKPYLIGLFLFLVSVSSFAEMQTYSEERMICRVTQDALTKKVALFITEGQNYCVVDKDCVYKHTTGYCAKG